MIMAKRGRAGLSREVRVRFFKAIRAGLSVAVAAQRCGVARRTASNWMRAAGGVAGNGPGVVSGWFLQPWEREEIAIGLELGRSLRAIAARLRPGRAASTVSREIRRNKGRGVYRGLLAQRAAEERARRPKKAKLASNAELRAWVEGKLEQRWSPEQISARLKAEFPGRAEMRVSPETIYQSLFVQGRGALRRELAACLRTGRTLRKPQRREAQGKRREQIPGMVMISDRPAEVADRAVPGHWEGDLIIGAGGKSAIGTLVERTTRYVILLHLPSGHGAEQVAAAMAQAMAVMPAHLRKTLTWDQGKELTEHARITLDTGLQVYFCDPHAPWQRGSNENTNGLLRQYFPKGTSLTRHTRADLDAVAAQLNTRPRKTLGWATPAQALAEHLTRPLPCPQQQATTSPVATTP
jgi:transposase, IS30 family